MKVFIRLAKAVALALMLLVLIIVGAVLMAWTKGLFVVLAGFALMVFFLYNWLTYRESTMRKEDRKWGV